VTARPPAVDWHWSRPPARPRPSRSHDTPWACLVTPTQQVRNRRPQRTSAPDRSGGVQSDRAAPPSSDQRILDGSHSFRDDRHKPKAPTSQPDPRCGLVDGPSRVALVQDLSRDTGLTGELPPRASIGRTRRRGDVPSASACARRSRWSSLLVCADVASTSLSNGSIKMSRTLAPRGHLNPKCRHRRSGR